MTDWTIPKKPRRTYAGKVASVTQIIGGLGWNREGLMRWANKVGREQGLTVSQARDPKADAGTLAHHLCECFLLDIDYQQTQDWCEALPETQDAARQALNGFRDWWGGKRADGWTLHAVEHVLTGVGVAGTADLFLRDPDGQYVVADIKTGSPHPEACIQLAAYASMFEHAVYRGIILHVPTDGRPVTEHHVCGDEFRAADELWHLLRDIHEHKKMFSGIGKRMRDATPAPVEQQQKDPF